MTSLLDSPRRPDISFHANGRIDISAHVARTLALRPGDVIDIIARDGEWFLTVILRAGTFTGRFKGTVQTTGTNKNGTFRTWNSALCRKALAASGQSLRLRCPCGEVIRRDNKIYVTIIYRCSL